MLFKKIKTINRVIKFVNNVESWINKHKDKIDELINIVKKVGELIPEAKEHISPILDYLRNLKNKK